MESVILVQRYKEGKREKERERNTKQLPVIAFPLHHSSMHTTCFGHLVMLARSEIHMTCGVTHKLGPKFKMLFTVVKSCGWATNWVSSM